MEDKFVERLYSEHLNAQTIPSPGLACSWVKGTLEMLFPELADRQYATYRAFRQHFDDLRLDLYNILRTIEHRLEFTAEVVEKKFLERLPQIREKLIRDADAICAGDPAALDRTEVIRTYPGFFAIAIYRLAHEFHLMNVPLIPRILTEFAHGETGIDIHPGASIGEKFCIDHGTGIVIGGTCVIGDHVKIYQGVTLGALSVQKEFAKLKRHPTIEDNVVIYAGTTILGGDTVIGRDSIIGGNVWLTKSLPPGSRVYYQGHINQRHSV
ncbi:serine O-acetyltransferase [Flavilitoribacter nigricans]|uniref:Serine acetyltransferase n=1 Tax=Flavilitoribacter nigricans (strain ATCC 23147 / DSM 23189 / NBRC 102662 / NCIMB 1420 / SS-2) TaxID=1122177 RepID=A0A2D0N385_FLAN2|nr:serine O-acetyltransferase [Flavilitoribacter nigricans]PHN02964.1 serine acetyltransferase [Flavilitoribacter nigricans DSM 23189 = NBRC 102662]